MERWRGNGSDGLSGDCRGPFLEKVFSEALRSTRCVIENPDSLQLRSSRALCVLFGFELPWPQQTTQHQRRHCDQGRK